MFPPHSPSPPKESQPMTSSSRWTLAKFPALAVAVAALFLLPLAASASASTTSHAPWHSCADVGPKNTDTAVYYIRMLSISCASGRRILRAWYYDRSAPNAGPRGWRCHVKVADWSERHYCHRGERRIRFTLFYA